MENDRLGGVRINKYLAQKGLASRRAADRMIADGMVTINGEKAQLGDQVFEGDDVKVKGRNVKKEKPRPLYIAFHKPVGVISTGDKNAVNNVYAYLDIPERIFHVGRLDVASSGLMLFTNDGDAAYHIMRSEEEHEKEYIVTVDDFVTEEQLSKLRNGVIILGRKTKPAKVWRMAENRIGITLTEGRNRQVRRMCEAAGLNVTALKRIRVMNVMVDDLPPGRWRELTDKEREELLRSLK